MDKSPVVATLKLVDEDHKHNSIVFDVVNDSTGTLPKQITLAKTFRNSKKTINTYRVIALTQLKRCTKR